MCRSTSYDFSLDALLCTQSVHEMTEGEAREEIWSSVNYLFFISTSSNTLGKVLCDQKI